MLSANEIRNVRFSTAMGGYKKEEVDILLDKVEADYEQFERTLREMNSKIIALKEEMEENKTSSGNIQNILVSAQKFADQIIEEAKAKSAEIVSSAQASIEKITEQEKELTDAFDKKASERKNTLQNDMEAIISNAKNKQNAIEEATQGCIDRQQLLFNKMKVEIAAFKAEVTAKYKEHLELLSSLPDTVPNDPEEIASAVAASYDFVPNVEEYVKDPQIISKQDETVENDNDDFEPVVETVERPAEKTSATGFVISADKFDIDDNSEDQEDDL